MEKRKTNKTKEHVSKADKNPKIKKKEKCEIWNKLDNILDKVNNYLFQPFILIIGITWLGQYYKQSTVGSFINVTLTVVFFVWIGIIVYKLIRRITKIVIIWPLIFSLVCLICSLIMMFTNEYFASDISFIVGMFFMEVFLIYLIVYDVYDKKNRISRVIISSVLFITLGYLTIFYSSYRIRDNTIFNSLIGVFSAIVGGGLTLGGVAWTIKHEKEEKRKEEIEKAKPYFGFNMLYDEPKNIKGLKVCFPEILETSYYCDTYVEIENSNQSVTILNRIYHDKKWYKLEANNMLIHQGKLILNFRFNNPINIILEVKDVFGNLYYYILRVLHTKLIGGSKIGVHTVNGIVEISKEETERIVEKDSIQQEVKTFN